VPLTIRGEQRPSPTAQIRDLAIPTETPSAIDWLQRLLDGWQPTHHLEAATIEQIPSILAEIDRLLQPAGQTAAGTELDRLFSVLPMPRRHEGAPDPIEIWLELVEAYPTDAIRRAVNALIAGYHWPRPPMPGDLMQHLTADRRVFELRKLRVKASVAMAANGAT